MVYTYICGDTQMMDNAFDTLEKATEEINRLKEYLENTPEKIVFVTSSIVRDVKQLSDIHEHAEQGSTVHLS